MTLKDQVMQALVAHDNYMLILKGLGNTILITVIAAIIGIIIAFTGIILANTWCKKK